MNIQTIFRVFFMSVVFPLTASLSAETLSLSSDLLHIEGRYQENEDGSATMSFPGVTTYVQFSGTALKLTIEALKEDLFLDVRIDGGEYQWFALENGIQTLSVATVSDGEHFVEIVRRNETWQGMIRLIQLEAVGGKFLQAKSLPEKKLMFIGDSITCGAESDIREACPSEGNFPGNGRLSYGYQISRILGTQCHLVSYGGQGIIRDWQGNRATNIAPIFYERVLADEEHSQWSHSKYVPDVIGICLGTNDFSRGIPDQNEFVNAYVEFVRKVRRDAPDAQIFLIDSPMFGTENVDGVKRAALNLYLDQIVGAIGCNQVQHLALGHFPGRPENAHPLAHEHSEIARILAPSFKESLDIIEPLDRL